MISDNYKAVSHLAAVKKAAAAYRAAYREHRMACCTTETAGALKDAQWALNNEVENACGGR